MKAWWMILLWGLSLPRLAAQEVPPNMGNQLENLAAASDITPDETLLLQLQYLRKHPLNLNTASAGELRQFPFLSPLLIERFLQYRDIAGRLVDVHELQAVPGWEPALIRSLLPFVTVAAPETLAGWRQKLSSGSHLVQMRWSRSFSNALQYASNEPSGFAGDPNSLLLRYLYRHPQGLHYGFVAEKDAGETLLRKGRATPDFSSFHFFAKPKGLLRTVALGDFTLNMGQGLVLWQALAFGKGPEVLAIKRQGPVVRPYASAGELYFLRGAAITVGKKHWEATLFGARQKTDAITGAGSAAQRVITSFPTSGLHRTASEYAARRSVRQQVAGGVLQYQKGKLQAAVNGLLYSYDLPIEKQAEPFNLYAAAGRHFGNFSASYSYTHRNYHFFGEGALDYKKRMALVQGALVSIHPQVDVSVLARHLPAGYTALAPAVFAETGTGTNEQGLYMGLQLRLPGRIRVQGYADFFRWPWLRFRVAAPGAGTGYLLQVLAQPTRQSEVYLLLRSENKPADISMPGAALPFVYDRRRQSVRLQWSTALDSRWQLRCRAEAVRSAAGLQPFAQGFLFFSDLQYRPPRWLTADFRLCWFNVPDTGSRIYAYEQDVLYSYSIPGFADTGWRGYATLRLKATRDLDIWLRLATTRYSAADRPLAAIAENRTDARVQVVWQW